MNTLKDFLANETGATAIEYGLIAAGTIITVVGTVGSSLQTTFTSLASSLKSRSTVCRYWSIGGRLVGGLSFHIRSPLPRQPSHGPARNRPLCDARHIGPRRPLARCLHGTPGGARPS